MRLLKFIPFLVATLLPANAGAAEGSEQWKIVAPWVIAADLTLGGECYMYTRYGDGTNVRFGHYPDGYNTVAYLYFSNTDWGTLEPGKYYPLKLQFDGLAPIDTKGSGLGLDGDWGFLIDIDKPVIDALRSQAGMRLKSDGPGTTHLVLDGINEAIEEMNRCQRFHGHAQLQAVGK